MILAVDSSVLLTILKGQPKADRRVDLLIKRKNRGSLVICEVVAAEVSALFTTESEFNDAMDELGIEYSPAERPTALLAGRTFADYRRAGGPRKQLIPDFIIGAHAT